jgi:tetratricopeptide (TPR) repeat protein
MKKQKNPQVDRPAERKATAPAKRKFVWWPWAVGLLGLFIVFEAYGPALDGPFVLDDRYLPFFNPRIELASFRSWVTSARPLLMASYWVDYQMGQTATHGYHVTNVVLHFLGGVILALAVWRLLERVVVDVKARSVLAMFAGGLFLLHPLQTESVAYVASRSEVLSVLFYYAALCVFLYKDWSAPISIWRALAVLVLFGAALGSKEHTLTLPALFLLIDIAWIREGWKKNALLYGMIAALGAVGAIFVSRVLFSNSVGFGAAGLNPISYFLTECRVIWIYLAKFVVPVGLNVDPDMSITRGFDIWAALGLLGLIAVAAAAWIYRTEFPLAALGVAIFFLLLAPTSSIVPIADVYAERRVYLPFLGLALIAIEFLRRIKFTQMVVTCGAILAICTFLTYQRSVVWASSLNLWQDASAKSPNKIRPNFQLAYALYEGGHCPEAAAQYEKTSKLGPPDYPLYSDWALALDCAGDSRGAIAKLESALALEHNAHAYALEGMVYGKQNKREQALEALHQAEKIDPNFAPTYVYRGNVYEVGGDLVHAREQYEKALQLDPTNSAAKQGLQRLNQRR